MKVNKKLSCVLLLFLLIFMIVGCSSTSNENDAENQPNEQTETPTNEGTDAVDNLTNSEVQTIEANMITVGTFQKAIKESLGIETVETIYDNVYQERAQEILDRYKADNNYTLENPLLIMNPFGTNRTGLYVYFNTEEATNIIYTISVEDEKIADFSAELYSNDDNSVVTEHEGQIIGLIQGMENKVKIEAVNESGNLVSTTVMTIHVPDFGTLDKLYFEMTDMGDFDQVSEGLFTVCDYDTLDPEEYSHMLIVDNYGVIRAEIILDSIKHNYTVDFIDGSMVYPSDFNTFVMVNRTGKVERFYDLGDYKYHHDFAYNESNHTICFLADDVNRETIEEIAVSLDLETGDVDLVVDFEELMTDIYERATRPETNMLYGTEFDWIHFNSIVFVNDTDVIMSSRELSSLIRVNDIYGTPTITGIIADELIWAGTAYEDLVYTKVGEFSSNAGQHNLTIIMDDALEEGQYYITLFNNNWGSSPTWPEFDWSQLEGVNLGQTEATEGNMESAWYKYLVDTNAKTYELVDQMELPYASFVSNAEEFEKNVIYNSGSVSWMFGENDSDGNVIVQFSLAPDAMVGAYRVMKYSYKNFWFN